MTAEIIPFEDPRTYGEKVAAEVRGEAARRRVTGARLAAGLGISPMSMSRRLTGRQPFTVDELAAVAAMLDVPVVKLLPHLDSNQKPIGFPMGDVIHVDFATGDWWAAAELEAVAS